MERRYIARVVGVRPEIVETRTDYLVAIPRFRKAFMIAMNPMAEAVVGRATAMAVVRKARAKDLPVFGDGKCIVYVLNDAWESNALVERAADVVAESQLSGLALHTDVCPLIGRALRTAWGWLHGLMTGRRETTAPEMESVEVRPASAPAATDSGEPADGVPVDRAPEDKVPA